jgi:uncharacterized protein YdaU (DUF1376 family)
MGLPWFAFNIKDFIANTTRLNTEAKGAYLMLMLDYYEQGQPPPDDDEVLATITGLPIDVWKRHRRVIEPLFDLSIVPGRWHHQRVEEECAKGRSRHASSMKGLEAANRAHAAMKGSRQEPATTSNQKPSKAPVKEPVEDASLDPSRFRDEDVRDPQNVAEKSQNRPSEAIPPNQEPSQGSSEAPREGPSYRTHKHKQRKKVESSNDDSTRASEMAESLIPKDFELTGAEIIDAASEGHTAEEVAAVVDSFRRYHDAAGTTADDWSAAWRRWWERKKPAMPPKAKPRVVVSTKAKQSGIPIPADWTPTEAHRRRCIERGVNIDDLAETFVNYCHQPAGRLKYSDHDRAFSTFILNQPAFNRGSTNAKTPPARGSIVDAGNDALAELDRRIAASQEDHGNGDLAVQGLSEN